MKRLILIFLLIGAVITPQSAYAEVKAGSACSKLGSTQNFAGKKYTCIKSGKKLVWNKGVLIAKSSGVPKTSTPTPQPSTQKVEIVSAQWAEVGKGCTNKGETAFTLQGPVNCAESLWTIVKKEEDSVESRAFRSVIEHWNKQPQGNLSVTFYIDANAGSWVNGIESGLRAGAQFWQTSPAGSRPIPAVISDNAIFVEEALAKAGIPQSEKEKERNRNAQGGQAGFHGSFDDPNMFMDFLFKSQRDRNDVGFYQVAPHEYTHFAQSKLSGGKLWDDEHMPWINEGIASYFGSALAPMSDMPRNQMDNWRSNLRDTSTKLGFFMDNINEVYESKYWGQVYPMGAFASEALVALVGVEGIINYYKDLSSGMGNQKAYIKNFKLNDVKLTQLMEDYVEDVKIGKRWSLSTLEARYKEAIAKG
jgi:hypothetical protein